MTFVDENSSVTRMEIATFLVDEKNKQVFKNKPDKKAKRDHLKTQARAFFVGKGYKGLVIDQLVDDLDSYPEMEKPAMPVQRQA